MTFNIRNCTGPVSNLVDFMPLLQCLPNSLTARAKKLHKDIVETYGGMINEIEQRVKAGDEVPHCLVRTLIDEQETLDFLDKTMICSAFMIGGVETVRYRSSSVFDNVLKSLPFQTASIMQWFSALIPSYPDIQARAHAELDRVVGPNRLPAVADEQNLPYIRAIIKVCNTCVYRS
jgi:cytochrome P450